MNSKNYTYSNMCAQIFNFQKAKMTKNKEKRTTESPDELDDDDSAGKVNDSF